MEQLPPRVDSRMAHTAALAQNPAMLAPQDILDTLMVLGVDYFGFDGQLHEGQIVVHQYIAADVHTFFARARELKFPIEKVIPISHPKYAWNDEVSCTDNNSSGYNYRQIQGTNRLSYHAYGLAFDINPVQNIYVRFEAGKEVYRLPHDGVYNPSAPGTLTTNHPLVTFMKAKGWIWGGDWKPESGRVDYQHFEKHIV